MTEGRSWGRWRQATLGLVLFSLLFETAGGLLAPNVAHAQQTGGQICAPTVGVPISNASVTTNFVAPYLKGDALDPNATHHDVGTKIRVTTNNELSGELTRTETLIYRATTTADSWSRVGSVTLTKGVLGVWEGEYTSTLPNGAYRYFALFKGYGKNLLNPQETLISQGCSLPQTVTKGPSEKDKFCTGKEEAQEVGFVITLNTKVGGRAEENKSATFEIETRLQKGLRNATQPKIVFKRSYGSSTHVFTTVKDDVPLGNSADWSSSIKVWRPQVSDLPPSPAGDYHYHAFGEVTVNGKRYTTCADILHKWGTATINDETVSLDALRKWFNTDENGLLIQVPTTVEGDKPFILAPLSEETGRPQIRFELAYIFGNGGNIVESVTSPIASLQRDFTMFQAYALRDKVKTKLIGVYYMLDDHGLEGHVEYWEKDEDAQVRRVDPTKLATNWDASKESYTDLYARLYNDPKDPASENCVDNDGFTKIGPKSKGADKEISDRGYDARDLNGNCINAHDYGWPEFWGVKVSSIPLDLSKSCAVQGFLSLFSEGIGVMIAKMLGCLAASLFEGVLNTIQPLLCEAAQRSMLITPANAASETAPQDCNEIKNNSPIQNQSALPRPPTSLAEPGSDQRNSIVSFFIGTAHAQNIGEAHNFENELKNKDGVIVRIWSYSRSLLNVIIVVALLAIAFANIFHFNINTYAAKKMLPGLVIGVVAANASLLIIRFLADVTQAVSQLAVDMVGDHVTITSLIAWEFPKAVGEASIVALIGSLVVGVGAAPFTGGISLLGWILVMIALIVYYCFLVISFVFAFIKRVVVLYFLSMLAPLAFAAYGIPQFQKYFYQWWEQFLRHLFLFPVILFGMALTVALADRLGIGDYANVLNPTNFISGLVSIILVMAAATMVLKLPKIFTKGSIDVMNTFKKAIGTAPRIAQGIQGANSAFGKFKTNRLTKQYQVAKDAGNTKLAARLRLERIKTSEAVKKREGKIKKFRGYSTLFARPELIQDAWQARADRDRKNDYIGAMTRTGGVVGMVRGAEAEAELAKKLGADELKDARTIGDLKDWADTLGDGHIKAVEKKGIKEAMKKAAKGNAARFEELRQKAGNLKSQGEVDDFIQLLQKESGDTIDVSSVKDYHDVMKWSAFQAAITRVARGIRDAEEGEDPYVKAAKKASKAYPDYSLLTPPPPGGGAPFAGAAQASATRVAQFTDDQIRQRVEEIFGHSSSLNLDLGGELQDRFMQNLNVLDDLEAMSPNDAGYATALEQIKRTLLETLSASTDETTEQLRQAINQANDPAQLTRLTENLSIAAAAHGQGGDLRESVASIVAQASQGTREFHQAHNDLTASIDYNRLESAITGSLQTGGADMAEVLSRELGAGIDRMSATLGKKLNPDEQRRLFQQMASQIQSTMVGPGQKTLRAVLQSSLQSLPKTFAKTIGVQTLKPSAMSAQIPAQPQASAPESPPTTTESS